MIAVGPWIASLWAMLGLPDRLDVRRPDGSVDEAVPMWTYWYLQEGEVRMAPSTLDTDAGATPPVLHVDSDLPLLDDAGARVSDGPWGIYVKPDRETVQGGAQPLTVGPDFEVDPYPTGSVDDDFPDLFCAALSHCMARFEGCRSEYVAGSLGRRRRLYRGQLPDLRPDAAQRLRRRRLQPWLQDDRGRTGDRQGAEPASTRPSCTRSATSGSRAGTCTRCPAAPIPGADRRPTPGAGRGPAARRASRKRP